MYIQYHVYTYIIGTIGYSITSNKCFGLVKFFILAVCFSPFIGIGSQHNLWIEHGYGQVGILITKIDPAFYHGARLKPNGFAQT